MANLYVSSAAWALVAAWAASTSYAVGAIVRQAATPTVGMERCFRCTTAGTSGASEPNPWNVAKGGTTTDGTVTWTEITGQEAYQAPGAWAAPYARIGSASSYSVTAATIANGGTSGTYAVNDVLTYAAGGIVLYGDLPTFRVTAVSAGKVTAVSIVNPGCIAQNAVTTSAVPTTGGGGSGCALNLTGVVTLGVGDTVYVGNAHAEVQTLAGGQILFSTGSATSITAIICVDQSASGHIPPQAGDVTTGATVTNTVGASGLISSNAQYHWGIAFTIGGSAGSFQFPYGNPSVRCENCSFTFAATNNSQGQLTAGATFYGGALYLRNCNVTFNHIAQIISARYGRLRIIGGTLPSGGSAPTNLFNAPGATELQVIGADLSGMGANFINAIGNNFNGHLIVRGSKIGSGGLQVNTGVVPFYMRSYLVGSDSGTAITRQDKASQQFLVAANTSIVRTGGANDGLSAYSWRILTSATMQALWPAELPPIVEWNDAIGRDVTATVYAMANLAALPTSDTIWLEGSYYGTPGSTLLSFVANGKYGPLGTTTNWTADTSAWDSVGPARTNSTAYALNSVIAVSGRVFVCSVAGTSSATLPAGYATATDGQTVTDGTATFRAGMRFVMTITFPAVALRGPITLRIRNATANVLVFFDPRVAWT